MSSQSALIPACSTAETGSSGRMGIPLTERQQMALVVKELEQQQALIPNIHKRNANGETPLHVAAIKVCVVMS